LSRSEFYDLKSLFDFRRTLDELGAIPAPRAALVGEPGSILQGRVGILPGSFNPPTAAHLDLCLAARNHFKLDHVVLSLSSVIIDKETTGGLCQEDRLLLLSLLAQDHDWMAVVAVNRGLYYQQVLGFRDLLGKGVQLFFIVGMDKVIQIFDPQYYDDRDAALKTLFFEAQLIAANRGEWGVEDLRTLLDRGENQAYEGRVYPLTLAPSLKHLSSTVVRDAATECSLYDDAVPGAIAEFIAETGAYGEAYEVRTAVLRALYVFRGWVEQVADLEQVVALAQGTEGAALRRMLFEPQGAPEELKNLLMSLGSRT
jgi:nicotinamide-nucleotide adenylyltransferase